MLAITPTSCVIGGYHVSKIYSGIVIAILMQKKQPSQCCAASNMSTER